nr:MAG TPA: hypothetical protein [Caudoviricetes sp.]
MFRKNQEKIDNLNARCAELARLLKEKDEELKIQRHNNELIMQENEKINNENADLRYENDELTDIVKRTNLLMTCNQYNNNESLKRKIIELTSDYQSIC